MFPNSWVGGPKGLCNKHIPGRLLADCARDRYSSRDRAMTKRAKTLTVATHANASAFYEGGHYELNLSFEMLRDRQWQRALETLWEDAALYGPLASRYYP